MMMMTRRIISLLAVILISVTLSAQKKDFGIWYGANLSKGITNKLDLNISLMARTYEDASKLEQGFAEAGVGYKINKHLDAALSYRLTSAIEDDSEFHFQHKLFLDLKSDMKASRFSFSARLRFQTRIKTYLQYVEDKYPDYTGRIKLKATYRTPKFPVNPYVYYEAFCPMFSKEDRSIGKNRFSAGISYKISSKHSIDIGYIYQRDYLPKMKDMSIIDLEYNLKL